MLGRLDCAELVLGPELVETCGVGLPPALVMLLLIILMLDLIAHRQARDGGSRILCRPKTMKPESTGGEGASEFGETMGLQECPA